MLVTAERFSVGPVGVAAGAEAWLQPLLAHFIALGRGPEGHTCLRASRDAVVTTIRQAIDAGCNPTALELIRVAEPAFATPGTWGPWGQVLELAVGAARDIGDAPTEGWALHQLGIREWAGGHTDRARELLSQALAVRTQAGDPEAAAATRAQLDRLLAGSTN